MTSHDDAAADPDRRPLPNMPPGFDADRCWDCGATIFFAPLLDKWGDPKYRVGDGERAVMPLDVGARIDGNVVVVNGDAHVMTAGELAAPDVRYRSHHASCPARAKWRDGQNRKTRRKGKR